MNHPRPEEWLFFIEGEGQQGTRQRLAEHLSQCKECRAEIDAWQRSIEKLERLALFEKSRPTYLWV